MLKKSWKKKFNFEGEVYKISGWIISILKEWKLYEYFIAISVYTVLVQNVNIVYMFVENV